MKAERRHELRENDLVHALQSTADYLKDNGGRVSFFVVVAIVLIGAGAFAMKSRASAMDDVWRQRSELSFDTLEEGRQSLDRLRDLTAGVSDPRFIMDSLMDQGRQALQLAQLAPDPPDPDLNERAREAFQSLRERFSDNRVAEGIALLGLATVEENAFVIDGLSTHKKNAHDYLTEVIRDSRFNGLPTQALAIQRRETLDQTFTKFTLASSPVEEESAEKDGAAADTAEGAHAAPTKTDTP